MGKLWQKLIPAHKLVERFTVWDNHLLDRHLVAADCAASIAHAQMLAAIGILKPEEVAALKEALLGIIRRSERGKFSVPREEEDCHTAIENELTRTLGEAGKKIHTGRSRNDQIIAALRLYTRDFLLEFRGAVLGLVSTLIAFAGRHAEVPMPGRTHMQIAMPSSVGLWAGAYAEELLDDLRLVQTAYDLNNTSPLGSAASYGVPLPLDREMVCRALGFGRVQNNVLYVNNSRGKMEAIVLEAVEQVMLTLSKLAQDLILFSMPEFGYFGLPEEYCTGSSIMPQKRNPDALELVRARTATVSACAAQIKSIIRALPSGYNGDFQETKAPFLGGLSTGLACVRVMDLVLEKLSVNEEKLLAGFIPEIFATDRALELVSRGVPFRDAYREVGLHLERLRGLDPREALKAKSYPGTTGNLGLELSEARLEELKSELEGERKRVRKAVASLTGLEVVFFREDG